MKRTLRTVTEFILYHRHQSADCAPVFAAWNGFASPLRGHDVSSTCRFGGHELWWTVDADSERAALALMPTYVAHRTVAIRVAPVEIP